ncbi:MAG: hypothetical protein COV74_04995 [Candidatus Omnitrophica bacterium CG11_big_fil_rev_8_21_14_0_20_45_26]|uniref:Glycosyltransferase RgtA/B/C/D-like domain-containing protein n=1 Tax=Candidatus Abzuiibacterium crystallinum TaxID=1974748 RepID=A0A2H0LPQ9_9BACT|nr:MAG: hypothetical protein COV74_04995 [Candidatus Omnitrophica bacterium CG11_big_fil_rev_8_21_14_0_20_45_26]PIW63618.1 MAG: hypothetical protein COW12_09910 [Candidatus Omnitrophica bacterium CG12_big_fil_rev_8_21_14_0_65_45_16]
MSSKPVQLLFFGLLVYFLSAAFILHQKASIHFPLPSHEETQYLWRAIGFQESGELLAPLYHADSDLTWKVPGYMVFLGTIFKTFGFSLTLARDVSFIVTIIGFLFLAVATSAFSYPLTTLFLAGLFLLNKYFVVGANVVSPETLIFALVAIALYLTHAHPLKAIAVLLVAPLIQPSGIYFLIAAVLIFIFHWWLAEKKPALELSDVLFFALAVAVWVVVLFYISNHWQSLMRGITELFSKESGEGIVANLFTSNKLVFYVELLFCFLLCIRYDYKGIPLILLAVAAFAAHAVGQPKMFYAFYFALGCLLASMAVLHCAKLVLEDTLKVESRLLKAVFAVIFVFFLYLFNDRLGYVGYPIYDTSQMTWNQMSIEKGNKNAYINEAIVREVSMTLESLANRKAPAHAAFEPKAEAIFFTDRQNERFVIHQPSFHSPMPAMPYVKVIHLSEHFSETVLDLMKAQIKSEESRGTRALHIKDRDTGDWIFLVYDKESDLPEEYLSQNEA